MSDASRAVFGAFDGLTSAAGMLAALAATGAAPHVLLLAAVGLGVASAVGMGAGDYLAGARHREAAVIGGATLLGAITPALPLALLPASTGPAVAAVLVALLVAGIAETRHRAARIEPESRARSYLTTIATIAVAAAAAVGASLLCGAA